MANNGFCSRCRKVWVLERPQGVCPWCGALSTQQTRQTQALRSLKSSRRRRQKQAHADRSAYDRLEGEWSTYYKVALPFADRAEAQDREDLLHDIMLTLAEVERNNGDKPLTEPMMYRIASRSLAHYWYRHYKHTNGLDCQHCSTEQRRRCRKEWLYPECPKLIKLEYLSQPIVDEDGNLTELGQVIADDKAIDLDVWLDYKALLAGCPQRLIQIANKIVQGQALTQVEHNYLWRFRKREQKVLF